MIPMKRLILPLIIIISLTTPAHAEAFTLNAMGRVWESTQAYMIDTSTTGHTTYYFENSNPKEWGYVLTFRNTDNLNIDYDSIPPLEYEPSKLDDSPEYVKKPKQGCKKKTNYGRLKIRLKNIGCNDATDILNPEDCRHGKSRWEFTCRDGRQAIKTEWAYKKVIVEVDDNAWKFCGTYTYVVQYAIFSADGHCDLTGVVKAMQADITSSLMPDGFSKQYTGFRDGNRLIAQKTNMIWDYAVPADGKYNWLAVWWVFPSLPALDVY